MKKNHLFKVFLLSIFCFSITISLSDCRTQQYKEIVVAKSIKEGIKSNSIGFINDIYEENKNTYIKFDNVEFYKDKDAMREYVKDGFTPAKDEFCHDYYIRNKEINNKPYILSPNCSINICVYIVNPNTDKNSTELTPISREDFKTYVNKWSNINELNKEFGSSRALLFSITIEDDLVTSINMEYTP